MKKWIGITLLAASALVAGAAGAGDVKRGELLYSVRCIACHDKSVHNRTARRAVDPDGIKAQVRRWGNYTGGTWTEEEVRDVATYLNELYYKFPCQPDLCPENHVLGQLHDRGG